MVLNLPFPFMPIQITLIDLVIEGYSSFFLSFEPNGQKVHGSFLRSVLRRASPNAIATAVLVLLVLLNGAAMGVTADQTQVVAYLLVGVFGHRGAVQGVLAV